MHVELHRTFQSVVGAVVLQTQSNEWYMIVVTARVKERLKKDNFSNPTNVRVFKLGSRKHGFQQTARFLPEFVSPSLTPVSFEMHAFISRELPEGAHYLAHDFSSALSMLEGAELADKADQVWIIGGSAIYKVLFFYPLMFLEN